MRLDSWELFSNSPEQFCSGSPHPERVMLRVFLITSSCGGSEGFTSSLHHDRSDTVRITVCRRPPVLHVPTAVLLSITRNTDRGASICNAIFELSDRTSFMFPGQAFVVAFSVFFDVVLRHLA